MMPGCQGIMIPTEKKKRDDDQQHEVKKDKIHLEISWKGLCL